MRKKFLALFFFAVILFSGTAHADFAPVDLSRLSKNPPISFKIKPADDETLPLSYDLRDYGLVTSVRDQGSWGTCWAFGTYAAMESDFLKAYSGDISKFYSGWTNENSKDVNFSVLHTIFGTYLASRRSDNFSVNSNNHLVTTPTLSQAMNAGGYTQKLVAVLARGWGWGPVPNAELSYDIVFNKSSSDVDKITIQSYDSYTSVLRLTDAFYLPVARPDDNDNRSAFLDNSDDVKKLIMDYGAIAVSYNHADDPRFLNTSNGAYFYSDETKSSKDTDKEPSDTNHVVAIIGWDDDFPVTSFNEIDRPSKPGAWLIKNSWGPNNDGGMDNDGCFWISYEQYLKDGTAFCVEPADKKIYTYGHDSLGWCSWWENQNGDLTGEAAAVFQSKRASEKLHSISFYTTDNNAEVEIYVYDYGTTHPQQINASGDKNLPADILKYQKEIAHVEKYTYTYAGLHTFKFNDGPTLTKGNYYGVHLIVTNPKDSSHPIAAEMRLNGYSDYALALDGESYFYDGSSWVNGASLTQKSGDITLHVPANACIKMATYSDYEADSSEENNNTIDNVSIRTWPTMTVSAADFEEKNPNTGKESDYKGRKFTQILVDNNGNAFSADVPVAFYMAYLEDLYETSSTNISKYGTGKMPTEIDQMYPAGYKPDGYFVGTNDDIVYPVYGPVSAKTEAEGKLTVDADNLVSLFNSSRKIEVPTGHYEVVYAYPVSSDTAPSIVGSLRVVEVTEANNGGGGGSNDSSGTCNSNVGFTWLAGLIIPALLLKKNNFTKKTLTI